MDGERLDLRVIARRAMLARGFLTDFPEEALAEADSLEAPGDAGPGARDEVRDLRHLLWCSIDNLTTRDLDQLTVAEPLADGRVRVLVAIADVDSLVREGSAIDLRARHNTTSVYTPGGTFHMLPERISTDLTSLRQGVDRLAVVVEMEVLENGTVAASEVYRALVHNHAKLVYEHVAAWLEGDGPLPERAAAVPRLSDLLRLQDDAARNLRRRRHERGALRLDRPEISAVVVDGCTVQGFREDRQNRARELIEDFMIAANEATARFLETRGVPSLRRVVHAPRRWSRLVELARPLGEELPPEPDSPALAAFLDRQREADPQAFPELSLTVTKLMGSGEYAVDSPGQDSPGHFGLAVEDYTHATAPNRRYPDLITQRQLKAVLDGGRSVYTLAELEELAHHCTVREDEANKVERQITKSAAALLLEPRLGENFEAVVTGASEKGTWVRLCGFPAEGRLVRGERGVDVGDRFRVRLVNVDVERGYIDFERER